MTGECKAQRRGGRGTACAAPWRHNRKSRHRVRQETVTPNREHPHNDRRTPEGDGLNECEKANGRLVRARQVKRVDEMSYGKWRPQTGAMALAVRRGGERGAYGAGGGLSTGPCGG